MKKLVLYDFDGTLTHSDSFYQILRFSVPLWRLGWGSFILFFRYLALFFNQKLNRESGKIAIIDQFWGHLTQTELKGLGHRFCEQRIQYFLVPERMAQLRQYQKEHDTTVVLVSASCDFWLKPFCESEGIHLICTELNFENETWTKSFKQGNCSGAAKAARIQEQFDLNAYDHIIAYGNSKGDLEMINLAYEKHWY
jgi:phosphatidylglycerophosphatase C